MEAVNIGIGTDNYLVPFEVIDVKKGYFLVLSCFDLNTAAEYFYQVGNDLVFEYLIIVCFKAVEYFSSYRDNSLKLSVSCHFYRAERRVTLHDVKLSL